MKLPQAFRHFNGSHITYRVDGYGDENFSDDGTVGATRYMWGPQSGSIEVRDKIIYTPRAAAYDRESRSAGRPRIDRDQWIDLTQSATLAWSALEQMRNAYTNVGAAANATANVYTRVVWMD
jgi:hypothetical protein